MILVILADDGFGDIGVHGGTDVPTPISTLWQLPAFVAPTAVCSWLQPAAGRLPHAAARRDLATN